MAQEAICGFGLGFRSLPTNNQDKQEGQPSEKRKLWNLEHCGQDK